MGGRVSTASVVSAVPPIALVVTVSLSDFPAASRAFKKRLEFESLVTFWVGNAGNTSTSSRAWAQRRAPALATFSRSLNKPAGSDRQANDTRVSSTIDADTSNMYKRSLFFFIALG
ncbi:hypothetical protein AURDEDRAFT_176969 [Auricularia subglabra TFB-10046 SS5]|uniref:Uncharacterized protein n=1 Tax=Auricularia subglabra (strain TFB-10046 / SS5) TaxID=717982 RepID=J0WNM9_AURST|nr:hypothetical protein AURDEDRAFT_176969 [Auricularia subglabra TFB-10046 SS5]